MNKPLVATLPKFAAPPCPDRFNVVARYVPGNKAFDLVQSFGAPLQILGTTGQGEALLMFRSGFAPTNLADGLTSASKTMIMRMHPSGDLLWIQTLDNLVDGVEFSSKATSASVASPVFAQTLFTQSAEMVGSTLVPMGSAFLRWE